MYISDLKNYIRCSKYSELCLPVFGRMGGGGGLLTSTIQICFKRKTLKIKATFNTVKIYTNQNETSMKKIQTTKNP
jgi:hypothetical protein